MKRCEAAKMSELLSDFLKETGLYEGIVYSNVCRLYNEAVGPVFAKATRPIKLENGKLTCQISSSVIRAQLNPHKESILKRINSGLQDYTVAEIKFS